MEREDEVINDFSHALFYPFPRMDVRVKIRLVTYGK
ncbi:hypothetical protein HMPREF0501_01136 [Limosilactobacillus coleohominis 101-4-CHN]|uniref:Uncharacterized protein n=1 Tax=Limosilactobacillus coleohominis 101-4-CHN TaxID=575594 RepID=C7XW71_9LACO|nr:hypothetical protein HMPREF0501_01136 [Limosilactobacillus coleohominis 101-4-CHN]